MTRPAHRPPNPHTAEGLRLVREEGMGPDEAAEQLRGEGKQISGKTIRRAMASRAAPPRPEAARAEAARADQPGRGLSSARGTISTGVQEHPKTAGAPQNRRTDEAPPLGPSLPAAKLADLRDLVGRLPFAQQDALVTTLPLERLRREAIARGLAPYHEAAAAVARELRAVRL